MTVEKAFELLEIVEKASPPRIQQGRWVFDVPFVQDGWTFEVFYDCGELDYLDHFISPDGERIEVFAEKSEKTEPWQKVLQSWRGMGDLERLRGDEFMRFLESKRWLDDWENG